MLLDVQAGLANLKGRVRAVRLLDADAPVVGLDPAEKKRIRVAEAMRRWRAANPEKVKAQAKASYRKNREKRLAEKRARRYGAGREEFLERARRNGLRYYRKNRSKAIAAKRAYYRKNAERICAAAREKRRAGEGTIWDSRTQRRTQ